MKLSKFTDRGAATVAKKIPAPKHETIFTKEKNFSAANGKMREILTFPTKMLQLRVDISSEKPPEIVSPRVFLGSFPKQAEKKRIVK